jgi:hypothetical protein
LALPRSVQSVEPAQLKWLARQGVTTIIATGFPDSRLRALAASSGRAHLIVIAPRAQAPRSACAMSAGTLRTCAAFASSPLAAIRLSRRSVVDYVLVRVRTSSQLRMLRGSHAKRSRLIALLPLSRTAAGITAWRAGVAYASTDSALELGVDSSPRASTALTSYLSLLPHSKKAPTAGPGAGAAPGTANLWVDTNGGSCTRQTVAGNYVDGQACAGVSAAYRAAAAGDTITVTAGSYGHQVVPAGTKQLTIRNAAGATPVFGTTTISASDIRFSGIRIQRTDDPGSDIATLSVFGANDTIDGVDVDTKNAPLRQGIAASGDNNTFKNGSTYNVVDEKGALVSGSYNTFDNFDFHDVLLTDPLVHNECVYSNGPNLTVKNSHFWTCATMDLFITRGDWWGQAVYGGITIINNVFEHSTMETPGSWHYYSLAVHTNMQELRNWKVINNTFETTAWGGDNPAPGTIWANNVGNWDCSPGATFSHNVGNKCAASDKAVSPAASCGPPACSSLLGSDEGWVSPSSHNFHLTAGSAAINAADPAYAPATDKDGTARSGAPDAGAYEYR